MQDLFPLNRSSQPVHKALSGGHAIYFYMSSARYGPSTPSPTPLFLLILRHRCRHHHDVLYGCNDHIGTTDRVLMQLFAPGKDIEVSLCMCIMVYLFVVMYHMFLDCSIDRWVFLVLCHGSLVPRPLLQCRIPSIGYCIYLHVFVFIYINIYIYLPPPLLSVTTCTAVRLRSPSDMGRILYIIENRSLYALYHYIYIHSSSYASS
jgi:hypothetical protein